METYKGPKWAQDVDDKVSLLEQHSRTLLLEAIKAPKWAKNHKEGLWLGFLRFDGDRGW